jgi:hypothetical protein
MIEFRLQQIFVNEISQIAAFTQSTITIGQSIPGGPSHPLAVERLLWSVPGELLHLRQHSNQTTQ